MALTAEQIRLLWKKDPELQKEYPKGTTPLGISSGLDIYSYVAKREAGTEPKVGGDEGETPTFRYTRGEDEVSQYYRGLDITPPTAGETAQAREDIRKQHQSQIDAIMKQYALDVAAEEPEAAGRLGQTRAMAAYGGRISSPMGLAQKTGMESYNKQVMAAITAQKDIKLAGIWTKIDEATDKRIEAERQEALGNRQAYIDWIERGQTEMKETAKEAFKAGTDYDLLSDEDREDIQKNTGLSDFTLSLLSNALQPESVKYTWVWKGNQLVGIGTDPRTGEMKETTTYSADELGLPVGTNPEFITDEVSGQSYWYDKDNPEMDAEGNLVLKPAGKIQLSAAEEEARAIRIAAATRAPYRGTTDYQNWELAGGEEGTGKTYAEWLEAEAKADILTKDQLNKLAQAGVPNDVALGIQENLNAGNSLEVIRTGLAGEFGQETGFGYLDRFMSETKAEKGAEEEAEEEAAGKYTIEDTKEDIGKEIQRLKNEGYERSETKTEVIRILKGLLELKKADTLPDVMKDIIEDALVEIYGKTRWQKVIPFGR